MERLKLVELLSLSFCKFPGYIEWWKAYFSAKLNHHNFYLSQWILHFTIHTFQHHVNEKCNQNISPYSFQEPFAVHFGPKVRSPIVVVIRSFRKSGLNINENIVQVDVNFKYPTEQSVIFFSFITVCCDIYIDVFSVKFIVSLVPYQWILKNFNHLKV